MSIWTAKHALSGTGTCGAWSLYDYGDRAGLGATVLKCILHDLGSLGGLYRIIARTGNLPGCGCHVVAEICRETRAKIGGRGYLLVAGGKPLLFLHTGATRPEAALTEPDDTRGLLNRAREGDAKAFEESFQHHRARLHQLIALRMDRPLAARADASDILQETYLEAFRRLPGYLEHGEMPFYLCLRWIARDKIIALYSRHFGAEKREKNA